MTRGGSSSGSRVFSARARSLEIESLGVMLARSLGETARDHHRREVVDQLLAPQAGFSYMPGRRARVLLPPKKTDADWSGGQADGSHSGKETPREIQSQAGESDKSWAANGIGDAFRAKVKQSVLRCGAGHDGCNSILMKQSTWLWTTPAALLPIGVMLNCASGSAPEGDDLGTSGPSTTTANNGAAHTSTSSSTVAGPGSTTSASTTGGNGGPGRE